MKKNLSRRLFLQKSVNAGIGLAAMNHISCFSNPASSNMRLGFITYQWGKDWDLPTLIANCEKTGLLGVELRTEHAHGVESNLNARQRADVKKRFADSSVTCVGYGSNYAYHYPDPKILRENIEGTKEYIKLCKDIGATGLKVKPNGLPAEVPKEKTIAQIAASLNEVGKYAGDYGQLIRVEVHGTLTNELPNMKAIFDQVTDPNVKVCWNSNNSDYLGLGLDTHFNMVKKWIGDTAHVHELDTSDYPFQQLFNLFASIDFKGWLLLETGSVQTDVLSAMKEKLSTFNKLVANITRI